MPLISGDCVAYYEFPGETAFQMERSADVLTSHHSRTSSVPHVSSSLATSHMLIYPWTTAEHSDSLWPPYQGTGTADQDDLMKLGSAQLNLMSLCSTLVWQLPIVEPKIGRHGGRSWKRQRPLDKPHDDDDDDVHFWSCIRCSVSEMSLYSDSIGSICCGCITGISICRTARC